MQSSTSTSTRVVVVTGGTKGIGRCIVEGFLSAGETVVACARQQPENLPAAAGRSAEFVACDVKDIDSVKAMVAGVVARHGRIDVLVNNAGGSPAANAATASPRFHESVIRLNLLAPFDLAQAANAQMQQIKEVVLAGVDASLETALALERKANQLLFATRDQKEGMQAFVEKRQAKFDGR